MLQAPIPATEKALARAGLRIDDIDLYEVLQTHPHGAPHRHSRYEVRPTPYRVQVNEAFASVPLAWLKEMRADPTKLNVNGGACALGHPLGGTGAKLMTTLVSEMVRRDAKYVDGTAQRACRRARVLHQTLTALQPTDSDSSRVWSDAARTKHE